MTAPPGSFWPKQSDSVMYDNYLYCHFWNGHKEIALPPRQGLICFSVWWTKVSEAWQEAILEPQCVPESGLHLQRDQGGSTWVLCKHSSSPGQSRQNLPIKLLSQPTSQGSSSMPAFLMQYLFGEAADVSSIGSERLGHLLKVTQLGSSRTLVHTHIPG